MKDTRNLVFTRMHHFREALKLFLQLVIFLLDIYHLLNEVHVGLYLEGGKEGGAEGAKEGG